MKLSISEARKRLPELVRRVSKRNGAKVEITVHDEVVAELSGTMPAPEPGAAATKQLSLMRKLPKRRGRKSNVSGHVKVCRGQFLDSYYNSLKGSSYQKKANG